jgi:hypothetical protein
MRTTPGELPKFLAALLLVASCSGRLTVLTSEDGGAPDGNGGSGATGNGNTTTVGAGGATTGAGGATGGSGGDDTTTSGGAGGTTIGAGGAGAGTGSGSGGSAATGAGGSTGVGGGGAAAGAGGLGAGGSTGVGGAAAGGTGGVGGTGGGGGGAAGGSGGTGADGGGTGGTGTDGGVCVPVHRGERRVPPSDLFVIADSSLSMDCPVGPIGKTCTIPNTDAGTTSDRTRFQILRDALTKLSIDQHPRDGAVGVLFSPFVGASGESCVASDYASPSAPLGFLSDDIVKAFAQQPRKWGSVLSASMQGAFDYVSEYRRTTPYRNVNFAMVLDGNDTTSCADDGTLAEKVAAIAAGYHPPMRTTVIGLGVELPALELIARAGATHKAHLIDTGALAPEEITSALVQHLRGAAATCLFPGPTDPIPDADRDNVNVAVWYSDFGHWRRQPKVATAAACGDGDGWYSVSPSQPGGIILCPKTCSELSTHADPAIAYESGCPTEIRP